MKRLIMLCILLWSSLIIGAEKKHIIFNKDFFDSQEKKSKDQNLYYYQAPSQSAYYMDFVFIADKKSIKKKYISIETFESQRLQQKIGPEVFNKYKEQFIDKAIIKIDTKNEFTTLSVSYEDSGLNRKVTLLEYCLLYIKEHNKDALIKQEDLADFSKELMMENLQRSIDPSLAKLTVYILLNVKDQKLLETLINNIFILKDKIGFNTKELIQSASVETADVEAIAQTCNEKLQEQKRFFPNVQIDLEIKEKANLVTAGFKACEEIDLSKIMSMLNAEGPNTNLYFEVLRACGKVNLKPIGSLVSASFIQRINNEKVRRAVWKYHPMVLKGAWNAYQIYATYTIAGSLKTHFANRSFPQIPSTMFGKASAGLKTYAAYTTLSWIYEYLKKGYDRLFQKNNEKQSEENK